MIGGIHGVRDGRAAHIHERRLAGDDECFLHCGGAEHLVDGQRAVGREHQAGALNALEARKLEHERVGVGLQQRETKFAVVFSDPRLRAADQTRARQCDRDSRQYAASVVLERALDGAGQSLRERVRAGQQKGTGTHETQTHDRTEHWGPPEGTRQSQPRTVIRRRRRLWIGFYPWFTGKSRNLTVRSNFIVATVRGRLESCRAPAKGRAGDPPPRQATAAPRRPTRRCTRGTPRPSRSGRTGSA